MGTNLWTFFFGEYMTKKNPQKSPQIFECKLCDYNTRSSKDYNKHLTTLKHKRRRNDEEKSLKIPQKTTSVFMCQSCNYETLSFRDYEKHLSTLKHKNGTNLEKSRKVHKNPATPCGMYKCVCGRDYKHPTSLWNHKQRCVRAISTDEEPIITDDASSQPEGNNTLMLLIKQNNEFKDLIISQNHQIIELSKQNYIVQNNTQTNTNSHNKTFNLNFFLNETCKDAMNITDFVNSLKLNLGDLEKVGELGYAEGISRLVVKGLTELEVTKRPIHCSDLKREVLHIKDHDKWEKDNPSQDKLRKVIKDISNKNIMLLDDWRKENPGCKNYDNSKNDIYLRMVVQSMGPADEISEKRDFGKIIRTIAKNTIIDKDFM
mgnify:CR=1 FL=1